MMDQRKTGGDRRKGDRRKSKFDARPETEKGMVGEQRSGKDRRNAKKDRRVHDHFAVN